jgi:uncharacterized protein YozE (UPF0346 family)
MKLQQIFDNLTENEKTELNTFGIRPDGKGNGYSLLSYERISSIKVTSNKGNEHDVCVVLPEALRTLSQSSVKIQYLVREVYRNHIFSKMDAQNNDIKNYMINDFIFTFRFCAPDADQFLLLNGHSSNGWRSLDVCLAGAATIIFIGTFYSFLLQDRKSFEGTFFVGGVVFPLIVLTYGWLTGK